MSLFAEGVVLGRPFWWEHVTWPDLEEPLPEQVDLLVIGAGYTGLSAAIAAHDAGARVAVIDSGLPGTGASTRNGGMLGAHPRLSWDTLASRYGKSTADALYAEAGAALSWVKSFLVQEEIDCDLQETGRIQLAYTRNHFEQQKIAAAQIMAKGGGPCMPVTLDGLGENIKTPLYKGGILFPHHAGLHPAKYLIGLLRAALARGIPVVPHAAARDIRRRANAHEVVTLKGACMAERVVLATNGYTGQQFPWLHRRVFPVPSFLIATEPLPADLLASLAPGRRMMVETRSLHSYFRISPDGTRVLFGGRAAMVDINLRKAARRLRLSLGGIWPELADVRLSHVWTGNTGFTFRHLPHVGVRNGIHYAMGYSGGGTVLAPWLGRKVALQALGMSEGETAFAETGLASRWYYRGGTPRFMGVANLWYRHWVDRRENREAGQ